MTATTISSVTVTKLFGYLKHTIDLDREHVVFIHGPNGCGKTTILILIEAIFRLDFSKIFKTRFEKLRIKFSDGAFLELSKTLENSSLENELLFNEDDDINDRVYFSKSSNKKSIINLTYKSKSEDLDIDIQGINRIPKEIISREYSFLRRVAPNYWRDIRTNEKFSYDEIVDNYSFDTYLIIKEAEIPEWFIEKIKQFSVHFIKTQRLSPYSTIDRRKEFDDDERIDKNSPIVSYSNELRRTISYKLAEQSTISQQRDSTFPERLLKLKENNVPNIEQVRIRFEENEQKIRNLIGVGLMDKQKTIEFHKENITPTQLQVINLYLDDMEKKLEVFTDLQKRIKTFLKIVSSKLRNKIITIDRKKGINIRLKNEHSPLQLDELSSGEQHQLVMFYELIFKTQKDTLFLVDEPEISLHVDWQRKFVDDLEELKRLGHCQFLVATHSPQIIGRHIDWAQSLDGGIL